MIVAWSLLARQDLEALRTYIAGDNPAAAARVARSISIATDRLARYPHLAAPVDRKARVSLSSHIHDMW